MPILSLVLPIHNQVETIVSVANDISKVLNRAKIDYEIILVENGSTDGTLRVLKTLAKKNKRCRVLIAPKGYGSAVLAGLAQTKGKYVAYMPSDGQLSPVVLPKLLALVQSGKCDMAKIRRVNRESTVRLIRSKVFNLLTTLLFGDFKIKDINGSPRIFSRSLLKKLNLTYRDSFIDTEFAVKARQLKLRIIEVEVKNLPRLGGKSTVGVHTVLEFLRNLIIYRFSGLRQGNWRE